MPPLSLLQLPLLLLLLCGNGDGDAQLSANARIHIISVFLCSAHSSGKQTSGSRTSCNQHFNCGNGTHTYTHTCTEEDTHRERERERWRESTAGHICYTLRIRNVWLLLCLALVLFCRRQCRCCLSRFTY